MPGSPTDRRSRAMAPRPGLDREAALRHIREVVKMVFAELVEEGEDLPADVEVSEDVPAEVEVSESTRVSVREVIPLPAARKDGESLTH
jgi:hypothetical protein